MSSPIGDNIILTTDSYKVTHWRQYPPKTTKVYSYFECRRGAKYDQAVLFGLQYILKRYLVGSIVTKEKIVEATEFFAKHFGSEGLCNTKGWEHIVNEHDGKLPLLIKAVPEGTVVDINNVLFTVENTCPECYWVTNYVEPLLVQAWYPIAVATNSREQKKTIARYLEETSGDMSALGFKLHDFGFRGASSVESSGIGDCAHLVNFIGTDTLEGIVCARHYYSCDMAAFSLPATEHSTMTCWGPGQGEIEAFGNALNQFQETPVSIVSDSYDVFNAIDEIIGKNFAAKIKERKMPCIVRPDSGHPPTIVLECLNRLEKYFGSTKNSKGYKELPTYIRVIQGDGIDSDMLEKVLFGLQEAGWSASNVVFGSGGALLQKLHRDTMKCAYKCCYAEVDGKGVNVYKDPITDPGKKSKKGRLTLERDATGKYHTIEENRGDPSKDLLEPVFENGAMVRDQTLDEIRKNARVDEEK
eukprot:Clim_evm68s149 gene=Clim_evmTU68s149